jgi:drug/metabolite transporter (DMT)-like permease
VIRADPAPAPEPGLLAPRVLVPFMIVSLIWGSTWLVIRDQLGTVPSSWSVTYRFGVAAVGMVLLTVIMRQPLKIDRQMMLWTILLGLLQFSFNFNFVYAAELHITSGLVAVVFALLIVPNAILAKWWLGRKTGTSFIIGSALASVGVAFLMMQEYRASPVGGHEVMIGLGLTLCGVLSASISNVLQVVPKVGRFPTVTILSWSMLWGTVANASLAFALYGPPVIDPRPAYLGGVLYLSIIGSVVTFPLYFDLIRNIGPGKAAYTGVLIPVIAMMLSTLFEGYSWSSMAAAGALLAIAGLLVAMQAKKA